MQQPILFNSGPKISRTNDNSLEFYSGSNQAYKASTLQGSDGHVVAHIWFHNDSDITLKDNVENVNTNDCYNVLKNVDAKTYTRNDIVGESRIGFIAQHKEGSSNDKWSKWIGKRTHFKTTTNNKGE